jgi:hypothetical protein
MTGAYPPHYLPHHIEHEHGQYGHGLPYQAGRAAGGLGGGAPVVVAPAAVVWVRGDGRASRVGCPDKGRRRWRSTCAWSPGDKGLGSVTPHDGHHHWSLCRGGWGHGASCRHSRQEELSGRVWPGGRAAYQGGRLGPPSCAPICLCFSRRTKRPSGASIPNLI